MAIARHVTVADMTADSHHFRTKAQLLAEGFEPMVYPPCDYHVPADADGAQWPGNRVRPIESPALASGRWTWFGSAWVSGYDWRTWEAICDLCFTLLKAATEPPCLICGDYVQDYADGWCRDCREENMAAQFGDYRPSDDCGCAWHNIYRVDADGNPDCYGMKRQPAPEHPSRRYEPGDEPPDYASRFAELLTR